MNTRFNIAFIGDRNVGKSRLIHDLVSPNLEYYPYITVGIELDTYEFEEKTINVWDCGCIANDLYNLVDFFYIVCDCDNWSSIKNVNYYINLIKDKSYIILVNKSDKITNKFYKKKITDYFNENHKNNFIVLNFNQNVKEILTSYLK